jgi:hypothetical protein
MLFVCHIDGDDKHANDAATYMINTAEYLERSEYITVSATHSLNFLTSQSITTGGAILWKLFLRVASFRNLFGTFRICPFATGEAIIRKKKRARRISAP